MTDDLTFNCDDLVMSPFASCVPHATSALRAHYSYAYILHTNVRCWMSIRNTYMYSILFLLPQNDFSGTAYIRVSATTPALLQRCAHPARCCMLFC